MNRFTFVLIAVVALLLTLSPIVRKVGQARSSEIIAAATPASPATMASFRYIDLFVDTGSSPLAAYQIEFWADDASVKLVGIEGGETRAFKEPPHYDPRALNDPNALKLATPRVIIAAFDTGTDLPTGRTRVARLMVRVGDANATPIYHANLQVAVSIDAKSIPNATLSFREGVNP